MKLLEHVRAKMRLLHYSWDTEECYVRWIERYIFFHKQGTVWRHQHAFPRVHASRASLRKAYAARLNESRFVLTHAISQSQKIAGDPT